jgi:rhodanese-related sulfurtransferase
MGEIFEIGYFQLENLSLNQVSFVFFDLRKVRDPVKDEPLRSMMKPALAMDSEDVTAYLSEKAFDKTTPIVLMCEDGQVSRGLASGLEEQGYVNVNVIENGFRGLLDEASALTHS